MTSRKEEDGKEGILEQMLRSVGDIGENVEGTREKGALWFGVSTR